MYAATDAIKKSLVQHNSKTSVSWIVYDVDTNTASTDWIDADAPPPNILAINPNNGHAHLFYGLETPVHNYAGASEKAIRYMGAVDIALTALLGADPGYAKFISKNPLHDRWQVVIPCKKLYTLDELSRGLDLGRNMDKRRNQPLVGYGRNCTLFHQLRRWAYTERRKDQQYLSYEFYAEAVRWRGLSLNAQFPQPLPHSEVRAISKSISKWTWQNMSAAGFKAWQRSKSIAGNKAKTSKSLKLRYEILKTMKACPEISQGDIAALLNVTRQTVNRHVKAIKGCNIPYIR
jgi:hypothetical protein